MNNGIVTIRGKEYSTVAKRVQEFLEDHPGWAIISKVIERTDDYIMVRTTIRDEMWHKRSVGHAEEYRNASSINKTSALENCETSAVGRALAFLGYGGTHIASAEEMSKQVEFIDANEVTEIKTRLDEVGGDPQRFLQALGAQSFERIQKAGYKDALSMIERKRKAS